MNNWLRMMSAAMALGALVLACSSPAPTPTPSPTPTATPTPVPTATPTPEPEPSGPGLAEGLAIFAGPLSAESRSCLDALEAENPDLTLTKLMGPEATALDGMRVIACLTDEEGARFPSGAGDVPLGPSEARCVLESVDEDALAGLTQGREMPPSLLIAMGACVKGMLPPDDPDDGTVSNPNDGSDTFTPPTDEERAAFIAALAAAGLGEDGAACIADGLTAIGVPLAMDALAGMMASGAMTEGPIAAILAECGISPAMLGGG